MAKIVIAGRSDCPYFSRVELLGDRLAKSLKKFKLHKIMVQSDKWEEWLKKTCEERGWEFTSSPIIWRELIDRGGKGVLIGGANEFQEYIKAYYDMESEMTSFEMKMVAVENKHTKDELDQEEAYYKSLSNPVNICFTNAANPVCYHLLHIIIAGNILGHKTELVLHLLVTSESDVEAVKGMAMEAEDLASSLLREVKVFTEPQEAFENCQVIIFLDEIIRQEDMSLAKWYQENQATFTNYGLVINEKAAKNCKVLVCGYGPVNFNATMIYKTATKIARQNIVAVSSLIENQAKAVIGEKLNVSPSGVVNVLVWGNINGKRYLDVSKCQVHGYDGAVTGPHWYSVNAVEMIHDKKWLTSEFPYLVGSRHIKVSRVMGRSTSLSCANSIAMLLKNWFQGSPHGQLFSLGIYSEGWYGIPEGIFFSMPVIMDPKGYWHVAQDIPLTPETKQAIKISTEDIFYELGLVREKHASTKDENETQVSTDVDNRPELVNNNAAGTGMNEPSEILPNELQSEDVLTNEDQPFEASVDEDQCPKNVTNEHLESTAIIPKIETDINEMADESETVMKVNTQNLEKD